MTLNADSFHHSADPSAKIPPTAAGWIVQILSTKRHALRSRIPATAVGGLFKSFLRTESLSTTERIPATAVGGLFRSFLGTEPQYHGKNPTNGSWWMVQILSTTTDLPLFAATLRRKDLNHPATAVAGISSMPGPSQ